MDTNSFIVHDTREFPLVSLAGFLPGMAATWCAELETLVKNGRPFVLLYPAPDGQESKEERAVRGQWMKQHSVELREVCRGLVIIEPDPARTATLEAMFPALERAFGVTQFVRVDLGQAKALAYELLDQPVVA